MRYGKPIFFQKAQVLLPVVPQSVGKQQMVYLGKFYPKGFSLKIKNRVLENRKRH